MEHAPGQKNLRRMRPVLLSEGRGDAEKLEQGVCHVLKNLLKPGESDRP
jgi:hypothetical protein